MIPWSISRSCNTSPRIIKMLHTFVFRVNKANFVFLLHHRDCEEIRWSGAKARTAHDFRTLALINYIERCSNSFIQQKCLFWLDFFFIHSQLTYNSLIRILGICGAERVADANSSYPSSMIHHPPCVINQCRFDFAWSLPCHGPSR